MTKIKKIVAGAVAVASFGAMSVTVSAETIKTPPVDWCAIYVQGAPSSVNKTYYYPIYTYGNGYDIACDSFYGDYNRSVEVRKQYDANILGILSPCDKKITDLHSTTYSPIYVKNPSNISGNSITFLFNASGSPNCEAYGVLSYHK